jgi:hypothetical protein
VLISGLSGVLSQITCDESIKLSLRRRCSIFYWSAIPCGHVTQPNNIDRPERPRHRHLSRRSASHWRGRPLRSRGRRVSAWLQSAPPGLRRRHEELSEAESQLPRQSPAPHESPDLPSRRPRRRFYHKIRAPSLTVDDNVAPSSEESQGSFFDCAYPFNSGAENRPQSSRGGLPLGDVFG